MACFVMRMLRKIVNTRRGLEVDDGMEPGLFW